MRIKLSQSDWQRIGEQMGWMKEAFGGFDRSMSGPERDHASDVGREWDSTAAGEEDGNDEDEDNNEFSYLTEGHEDDARMARLRQTAESLVEDDDSFEVHAALYWLLSNYHGGQDSPEYAALSSSPYNPGPMEKGPRGSAKFIYDQLEQVFKS